MFNFRVFALAPVYQERAPIFLQCLHTPLPPQGTCEARAVQDISFAIPESESFFPDSYVVATSHSLNSVGFISEVAPGSRSLFIGGFVSADGEFTSQVSTANTNYCFQIIFQIQDISFNISLSLSLHISIASLYLCRKARNRE